MCVLNFVKTDKNIFLNTYSGIRFKYKQLETLDKQSNVFQYNLI